MYAVIRTGGKQYRVQPGDLLVVEKLAGEPGAAIAFDDVLMIGRGEDVALGAPTVAGAKVEATLIETRKGEKIKIFKKIRRKGYRRTGGHRQIESVLRVTGIAADGASEQWDGTVDLTPLAMLNARARNLARGMEAAEQAKRGKRRGADEDVRAPAAAEVAVEAEAPTAKKPARKAAAKSEAPGEAKNEAKTPRKKAAKTEPAAEPAASEDSGKAAAKKTPARRRKPGASEEG